MVQVHLIAMSGNTCTLKFPVEAVFADISTRLAQKYGDDRKFSFIFDGTVMNESDAIPNGATVTAIQKMKSAEEINEEQEGRDREEAAVAAERATEERIQADVRAHEMAAKWQSSGFLPGAELEVLQTFTTTRSAVTYSQGQCGKLLRWAGSGMVVEFNGRSQCLASSCCPLFQLPRPYSQTKEKGVTCDKTKEKGATRDKEVSQEQPPNHSKKNKSEAFRSRMARRSGHANSATRKAKG